MKFIVPQQPQLQLFLSQQLHYYNDCSTYQPTTTTTVAPTTTTTTSSTSTTTTTTAMPAVCKSFELISTENSVG
jgi:hypothetical protein